jgi:hypothetical protein
MSGYIPEWAAVVPYKAVKHPLDPIVVAKQGAFLTFLAILLYALAGVSPRQSRGLITQLPNYFTFR